MNNEWIYTRLSDNEKASKKNFQISFINGIEHFQERIYILYIKKGDGIFPLFKQLQFQSPTKDEFNKFYPCDSSRQLIEVKSNGKYEMKKTF